VNEAILLLNPMFLVLQLWLDYFWENSATGGVVIKRR